MSLGDIFIFVLFSSMLWFSYWCGSIDCHKNGCYRGECNKDD